MIGSVGPSPAVGYAPRLPSPASDRAAAGDESESDRPGAVRDPFEVKLPGADRKAEKNEDPSEKRDASGLTEEQRKQVREMAKRDAEVRAHEQAHIAAGAPYTSGASYSYEKGPDGRRYVVGGEVGIDTSPVKGDPEATARKMEKVASAALAPAEPSSQDLKVARAAEAAKRQAEAEIQEKRRSEIAEAFGSDEDAETAPAEGEAAADREGDAKAERDGGANTEASNVIAFARGADAYQRTAGLGGTVTLAVSWTG